MTTVVTSWRGLAALALAGLSCLAPALAQTTTGDITGRVSDQSGAAVSEATVNLTNRDTGQAIERITDAGGNYVFSLIRPGRYSVSASGSGFERVTSQDIQLLVGQRVRVDLELKVGAVTETVEVVGGAVLLESQSAALGQVIGQRTIEDLPLNGRNFMQLTQLTPGVIPAGVSRDASRSWTNRDDTSASISGQRLDFTSFLLDGVETRASRWGQPGIRPSVDAIQEFKVQRNTFSAEFGFNAVAINTAMKSGSNSFHGSAFEFLRNQSLDARNFFDLAGKSGFRQNNFGGTIGGPIKRDKLFFFGNYEGLRQRLTRVQNAIYPETAWLQGNFSNLAYADGTFAPVYDALGGGIPFPGNAIPTNRLSGVAQRLAAYSPAPNVTGDRRFNTTKPVTDPWDWDQYHARVDRSISERDTLFYRFSLAQESKFQNTIHQLGGGSFPQTNRNLAVSETHAFSPALVNEARFGWNRTYLGRLPEGAFGPDIAKEVGLRNVTTIPESFGPPRINLTGLASFGANQTAIYQIENFYHVADNLSWTRGKHTLKLGGEFRRFLYQQNTTGWEAPKFNFTGQYATRPDARGALPLGASVADYMLGHVFRGDGGDGTAFQDLRTYFLGFFLQDDFRVTSKLTLNLGLRYEMLPAPYDINGRMQYFDFDARRLRVIGEQGAITKLHPTDRNNWGPRFGFAYSPGSGKTVIRGGYGIYYVQPYWNDYHFLIWGPPYYGITSVFSDQNRPTLALDQLFDPFDIAFSWLNSNDTAARTPYTQQWSFGVQRELGRSLLVEVGYAGSTSKKLSQRKNANPGLIDPTGTIPIANRRVYPGLGDILYSYYGGMANYNAGTVKVEKRYSAGLSFLGSYTFMKAIDWGHSDNVAMDGLNTARERAISEYNATHRLVLSALYELPFGRGTQRLNSGLAGRVFEGWQLTTITTFQTGNPIDLFYVGQTPQVGIYGGVRPNRVGPGDCSECRSNIRDTPNLSGYFRTSDFAFPAPFTFGNSGRNPVTSPGLNNWDLSVLKTTAIREGHRIQFRAEFFNAFNHAQFATLGTQLGTPFFGNVLSARTARNVQFGLKYLI